MIEEEKELLAYENKIMAKFLTELGYEPTAVINKEYKILSILYKNWLIEDSLFSKREIITKRIKYGTNTKK